MATSPQLKRLKIENLFGYKDIELDFSDVNVLVGRNGLGKTTILKILNAMLSEDFNCSELKLCDRAIITFTNKSAIFYEPKNSLEVIARDAVKKVFTEKMMEHFQKEEIKLNEHLKNEFLKEITRRINLNKINPSKEVYQTNAKEYISFFENEKHKNIRMSKALNDYIARDCEVRYISTINMSANAQQDIKMSSGKEKNILNWELNLELAELAKDKNSEHTSKLIEIASDLLSESNKILVLRKLRDTFVFDTIDKIRNESIKIESLSSGERQLLYILSRVANTKNKPAFLLMDEPEISLHLNWQEKLIPSIKKLNQNCQIIIVTHSPAIVMDGYMDAYVDMDDITTESDNVRL
ncbi:AAA family ATPase [Serratia ureilytica]|uniref:AAA family ATPase n=1 Tax=Serratia ureilytica TaxID=300181 RepID=UPI00313D652C